VTNTRSPQTTGADTPVPLRRVFHETFSVSLHFSGRRFSVDVPVADGPRQCGQFSAAIGRAIATPAAVRNSAHRVKISMIASSPV
jgi:hypothetical protein